MDPFKTLKVGKTATAREIAAAYRTRVEGSDPKRHAVYKAALMDIYHRMRSATAAPRGSREEHAAEMAFDASKLGQYDSNHAGFEYPTYKYGGNVLEGHEDDGNGPSYRGHEELGHMKKHYDSGYWHARTGYGFQKRDAGRKRSEAYEAYKRGYYHGNDDSLGEASGSTPPRYKVASDPEKRSRQKLHLRAYYDKKRAAQKVASTTAKDEGLLEGIFVEGRQAIDICLVCDKKKMMKSISPTEERCQNCSTKYFRTDSNAAPIVKMTEAEKEETKKDDSPFLCLMSCGKRVDSTNAMQPFCSKGCYDEYHKTGDWQIPDPTGTGQQAILNVTPKKQEKYRDVPPKNEETEGMYLRIKDTAFDLEEAKAPKKQKWELPHTPSADHIVKMYDAADKDTKAYGHSWYETAGYLAKKIGEGHENGTHKAAGVLSAYSPRTNWGRNIMHATRAMKDKRGHGGPGEGAPAAQGKLAHRIIQGEHHQKVLGGEKTKSFAELIEHGGKHPEDHTKHSDRVVVDRHAVSIAIGKRLSNHDINHPQSKYGVIWKNSAKGKHHYGMVADAYKQAADHISKRDGVSVAPHQVQATTWEHYRKTQGISDVESGGGFRGKKVSKAAWEKENLKKPRVKKLKEMLEGADDFYIEDMGRPFGDEDYDEAAEEVDESNAMSRHGVKMTFKDHMNAYDNPRASSARAITRAGKHRKDGRNFAHALALKDSQRQRGQSVKLPESEGPADEGIKYADKKFKYLGDDKTAKKQKSIISGTA